MAARAVAVLLLAPTGVLAGMTPMRFLQQSTGIEHKASNTTISVDTAHDYIKHLRRGSQGASLTMPGPSAGEPAAIHAVCPGIYGQIRQPGRVEDMRPFDKVVTWLVGSPTLAGWLDNDRCAASGLDPELAWKHCLCGIADDVEVPISGSAVYQIVVLDASLELQPLSPTWANFHAEDVLPRTYEFVFGELEAQGKLATSMAELLRCRPSSETWAKLALFNSVSSAGLPAYRAIMEDPVFGLAGQMGELGCSSDVREWSGGCGCRGPNGQCTTQSDAVLFCGSDPDACDPRPFLCPGFAAEGQQTLPVGYVRAYLHKFLYALPAFTGHGFTDNDMDVVEFIAVPSIYLGNGSLAMTPPQGNVSEACPWQHRV